MFAASPAWARVDHPAAESAEPPALAQATRAWKALDADKRHRERRDLWTAVVDRLERVARGASERDTRATALLRAGEAAEDMAVISRTRRDFEKADGIYRSAAEEGAGNLAREALRRATRLEEKHLGGARTTSVPAAAPTKAAESVTSGEDSSLRDATARWERLKADPKRRMFRDQWQTIIDSLSALGDRHAPAESGALAYFRAAKAAEDLSSISRIPSDAARAATLYLRVAKACPESSLVASSLSAAANLEFHRLGEEKTAREHLTLASKAKGADRAAIAEVMATLPPETKAAPTAAVVENAPAVAPKSTATEPAFALPPDPPEERAPSDSLSHLISRVVAPPTPVAPAPSAKAVRRLTQGVLADSSLSLSEQVGLKVKRIIVDAGHGGHDTGAVGPKGLREKDVTLAIAQEVARQLRERGYEAVLTRDSDDFVALEERTAIANKERGDLFVSIHANANPSHQLTGVETYSLNTASNRYAMRLAARENATSDRSVSDLQYVLADLATRANTVDSDRLAECVQRSVVDGVGRKYGRPRDNGVKHALFYVLLGTHMPAILVETQFISNAREEKHLAAEAYQLTVARSIASGIDQFVARRQQLAAIDR
jgi:N-acetylmuramoyl-L-alanine amidase